jgi:hypothetical protein
MSAFPPGVPIRRIPFAEATSRVQEWLSAPPPVRQEERV